ncbi:uncharacterized protein B0I36DRAFT_354034 [Microdochium trichocladiopsis]|uniref:Polymerase/histidinol phosphatase N-terminal domain-containing protein n=1 Tax=Microdochium trichocladiopsis TaxID=1682393 RepID=A0A9P9BIA1_9PEZI|nr:uncharacterized protein B0I36DRAFT_354034 [Microdochium trichocladiopsis]KAH7021370.1 hypothetical protein B0I36DRAFT_354034 [Microdochium trichocladiopsis]
MKTLTGTQLSALAGDYFAPEGLYQYTKSLPFLGSLQCNTATLTAGQWTELIVTYTVGASGLADGAWVKGTFKFYSDWALLQTSDPRQDNYVSAEYTAGPLVPGQTPATVQGLAVRFDQKDRERPFQKAIIVDVVDGYLNPGDKITVRVGDRRWGARGTRVQTFVEDAFRMRWYIDPVGTSRFAPIKPDIEIPVVPGQAVQVKAVHPRVVRPGVEFPVNVHLEDVWGNTTMDKQGLVARCEIREGTFSWQKDVEFAAEGWTVGSLHTTLPGDGDYTLSISVHRTAPGDSLPASGSEPLLPTITEQLSVSSTLPIPRPLFADLHVHSDDTVGTNSTTYNFSYAQLIAGLDVVGYTANDFNVTESAWASTLAIIRELNVREKGKLVIFPGTEWCGNSAVGGDHNVVFLGGPSDPAKDDGAAEDGYDAIEFPHDKHGNVARSFEWNEHGPAELAPGAWPLDEVYATYAHDAERHLLIPHVGGRRCNLAWHHPKLERLLEIGSAWGLFEWLLRDSVQRGWRLGVSANSDEHRGRCGGGVPGTAVFGTKGGLTGVLADELERGAVAQALRARRTFATTGERLVGIITARAGENGNSALQGDELQVQRGQDITFDYHFYGNQGFESIEAWDDSGIIFKRNLQQETAQSQSTGTAAQKKVRIKWGGARLYDRYREAVWHGSIIIGGKKGSHLPIERIQPFGGVSYSPEEVVKRVSDTQVTFRTRTSGDFDGVDIYFSSSSPVDLPLGVSVTGHLDGYVKVGNVLAGNPHKAQPRFELVALHDELLAGSSKRIELAGGADLFVSAEVIQDVNLPTRVEGTFALPVRTEKASDETKTETRAVYFVAREWNGGKVITSPVFVDYV